jgi:methylmalonyl-CoA/ethylmalonyl-CoA epimerase
MKLNHLGFGARDIGEAVDAHLKMGYTKVHEDMRHHVPKNMFVQRVQLNGLVVEIMAPADPERPCFVGDKLTTTTEPFVLHHVCYDVDDIQKTFEDLMATGEFTVFEPITDGVFQKNKICFLKSAKIGYVEFFEWPKA